MPAYETPRQVSSASTVVLQANPGPMTLDGTNTWVLRGAAGCVVVDPGDAPDVRDASEVGERHLDAVLAAAPALELILLTHGHHDHSALAAAMSARTGAPVRAADPQHCHAGGAPLSDGETLHACGLTLQVLATPGHTADSVCFLLDSDGGSDGDNDGGIDGGNDSGGAAVLTGDTILGRGTTVVAHPDGVLRDYLDSLRRLQALGALPVLPGHGPELPSVGDVAAQYLRHRQERLEQVRAARTRLGAQVSARQVVETVYADVDPAVWWAAELSVQAQLDYLRDEG